jgi:hypothetical protein
MKRKGGVLRSLTGSKKGEKQVQKKEESYAI